MITQPLDRESAQLVNKTFVDACNSSDTKALLNLLTKDIVWKEKDILLEGRGAVWDTFKNCWMCSPHFAFNQEVVAFSDVSVTGRFSCEWLDSENDQWLQKYGTSTFRLTEDGLIASIEIKAKSK